MAVYSSRLYVPLVRFVLLSRPPSWDTSMGFPTERSLGWVCFIIRAVSRLARGMVDVVQQEYKRSLLEGASLSKQSAYTWYSASGSGGWRFCLPAFLFIFFVKEKEFQASVAAVLFLAALCWVTVAFYFCAILVRPIVFVHVQPPHACMDVFREQQRCLPPLVPPTTECFGMFCFRSLGWRFL